MSRSLVIEAEEIQKVDVSVWMAGEKNRMGNFLVELISKL